MKSLIVRFILLLMMIIPTGGVFSEAPDRQALENQLIVVRQHGFWPRWVEYDGIWQFNLETQEYKRLRHIFFSPASEYSAALDWGYLGSEGDKLFSQAWPDDLWFDMFTMRMENRIPVPNADSTHGWALQGPILDAEKLDGTGLEAGRYGFVRCIPAVLNEYQDVCEEFDFPGYEGSVFDAVDRYFLFNHQNRGTVLSVEPVVELSPPFALSESQVHSYDIGRMGFWRGTDRTTLFYPVRDGSFLEPSIEVDFSELVGNQGSEWTDWSLGTLFFNSKNEQFFGLFRFITPPYSLYDGRVFFSSTPDSDNLSVYEVGNIRENTGLPVWFGAFDSAPPTFEQIVPIVADTEGDNGTHWVTDLWLFNPSDAAAEVTIGRLTSEAEKTIDLPAHGSVHLENVLAWIGGGLVGDGVEHDALFVSSPYHWGQQVNVVGRMWTQDEDSGGTFGHTVPAVPAPYGFSNHHGSADNSIWLTQNESHIDLDLRQSGQFRHNLGITNVLDEPIQITLHWAWSEGLNGYFEKYKPENLSQVVEVPPRTILILRPEDVFPAEARGWPPRIAIRSDSPALIWFSMVDNLTGDATFVPYANYAYVPSDRFNYLEDIEKILRRTSFVLPVAVSGPGENGTMWQTDLIGYEGNGVHKFADQVYAAFWPSTTNGNCTVADGSFIAQLLQGELAIPIDTWYNTLNDVEFIVPSWLNPAHLEYRWRTIFPDVVHLFEECADTQDIRGGVGVTTGSWFSGFSRTYTTQPDGGTYGAMLPLYPPNGWPVQHFAGLEFNDQTRINIGFFNGDFDHAITHRVTLYAEDGTQVAQRSFTLNPFDSKQMAIQNLFNGVDLQPGTYGLTVLPLDQEAVDEDPGFQGHSWAYVSVIDNLTNDPINLW